MDLPDDAPAPRNCQIIKWPDFEGYGFNLHAEKNRTGQFIGKVDEDSPAELAGLRPGDRIVEVNGVNIANENHKQVVERIKAITNETELLVLDEEADNWYKQKKIVVKSSMSQVICTKTPIPRPGSNVEPEPEPEEQEEDYEHETDQVIRQMKSEADRVEDEEPVKLREVTPTSDRKSFQDSPRSSLSSEHRSTPPTSPVTPEPTPLDKPVEIRPSNGHSNGTANGRPSSGLNLNMSAQEMRQMLAQRKKKDIRKDQMDIRKKYDLVQKM